MNNVPEDNKVRTWTASELPASKEFAILDHHHNMVRRLQLLPHSARGQQIKKNVAYLYLQHILMTGLKGEELRLSLDPRCVYENGRNQHDFTNRISRITEISSHSKIIEYFLIVISLTSKESTTSCVYWVMSRHSRSLNSS